MLSPDQAQRGMSVIYTPSDGGPEQEGTFLRVSNVDADLAIVRLASASVAALPLETLRAKGWL